jgi:benzil reductase ((S)-benzoin forming)
VSAYPGLGPYSASKAALRMAGMVLAAELGSPKRERPRPDTAVLSYEPGAVDTEMQVYARSHRPDMFPWVDMFYAFVERKMLVPPAVPAAEIVEFLESDGHPAFSEARLGRQ